MTNYKVAMVLTDSFHNDIDNKNYKYGSPNKIDDKSKPIILYYFLDDYERVWDEGNPITYDDEKLKNNASVTQIDYTDKVLLITLFNFESFEETSLKFEVGKETSIPEIVDENDHSQEYKFTPTKIVVADGLLKDTAVFNEIISSVWEGYYSKQKDGEKLPKVAENVQNAESHSHKNYKKCAECSDSVFGLEEEICFECSSFGAETTMTVEHKDGSKYRYSETDPIYGEMGEIVGHVSEITDEQDTPYQKIYGRDVTREHNFYLNHAETYEAQGKPTWAGYCPFCKKWRTNEWSKKYGGDTVCAKMIPDPHYRSGDEALFGRENFARKGGKWIKPKENICGVVLEKKQSKNAESFEANSEGNESNWKKVVAEWDGLPAFLRTKPFRFEKQFTMPPYPNTLEIIVDGFFTGISYEDLDPEDFNASLRKQYVSYWTDEKLEEMLESSTMELVKVFYEEIADEQYFGDTDEEEFPECDWCGYEECICEEEDKAKKEKYIMKEKMEHEKWKQEHIEYCDKYFVKQMKRYMKENQNTWFLEDVITDEPMFIPTYIRFSDKTIGKTIYEYKLDYEGVYGAETFEAKVYDPMMQKKIDQNECTHKFGDGEDAWNLVYSDIDRNEFSYVYATVKCDMCSQERYGSWGINEKEGFEIVKGEEGRMPKLYGFYGAENEVFNANAKSGDKVYIITRRCEDYSAYRELDVAVFGSKTEAKKKFNILFKEAKKQEYPDETIADAKSYMRWGDVGWGIESFMAGDMIYELNEHIVGNKGDFYFDAETFESESDCREAKEEVKKLRRKIALLDKLHDKENALHHEILGSGGFFKEHELKGLFSEKDLENYEYWS